MNTANTASAAGLSLPDADRIGVAASVLCAIHCGLAPVLLLALPAFGEIWAHPASHTLVAILIVPLAIFSIRKGYRQHRRRWVALVAATGILCVLVGAALPAFSEEIPLPAVAQEAPAEEIGAATSADEECSAGECAETCDSVAETCDSSAAGTCNSVAGDEGSAEEGSTASSVGCIDNCCPSAQISESGEITLHIPPAAIVTTLGGLFLITAHVGNLMGCRDCCQPVTSVV